MHPLACIWRWGRNSNDAAPWQACRGCDWGPLLALQSRDVTTRNNESLERLLPSPFVTACPVGWMDGSLWLPTIEVQGVYKMCFFMMTFVKPGPFHFCSCWTWTAIQICTKSSLRAYADLEMFNIFFSPLLEGHLRRPRMEMSGGGLHEAARRHA